MRRREMMGGGFLAGVAAMIAPKVEAAGQQDSDDTTVARAIDKLREAVERQQDACFLGPCNAIKQVRSAQLVFLKANQKFPDFIDVGTDLWHEVWDWHVKNQQQIGITRLPDGRYGLGFMFTTLVMRPENPGSYISFGYDAK